MARLRFLIFLTICAMPTVPIKGGEAQGSKAGAHAANQTPIFITIRGIHEENATSCLGLMNRNRRKRLAFPEKGDGEYQIVVERKRPGYQVRVEKMGSSLKTARALYDYEICIAAAAMIREAIADE